MSSSLSTSNPHHSNSSSSASSSSSSSSAAAASDPSSAPKTNAAAHKKPLQQKKAASNPRGSAANKKASSGHDIWHLIETKYQQQQQQQKSSREEDDPEAPPPVANESKKQEVIETNILFLGSASSGKTSLLQRVLLRSGGASSAANAAGQKKNNRAAGGAVSDQEPSIALEYTYGRKEDGYKLFIGHFWELAGGTSLLSLSQEIISAQNIHTYAVVICLDLTQPDVLLGDFFAFIHHLEKHANAAYELMRSHNSKLPAKIMDRAKKRFSATSQNQLHEDLERVHLFGIPLIIVANKYDKFQQMFSPQHVKVMAQVLRYLAHVHGATVLQMDLSPNQASSHSVDSMQQQKAFRQIMNNIMFSAPLGKEARQPQIDSSVAPIKVLAGTDSLKSIGSPVVSAKSTSKVPLVDTILKNHPYIQPEFLHMYCSVFNVPSSATMGGTSTTGASSSNLRLQAYPEPMVDAMRKQKDDELQTLKADLRRSEQQQRQRKKQKAARG